MNILHLSQSPFPESKVLQQGIIYRCRGFKFDHITFCLGKKAQSLIVSSLFYRCKFFLCFFIECIKHDLSARFKVRQGNNAFSRQFKRPFIIYPYPDNFMLLSNSSQTFQITSSRKSDRTNTKDLFLDIFAR